MNPDHEGQPPKRDKKASCGLWLLDIAFTGITGTEGGKWIESIRTVLVDSTTELLELLVDNVLNVILKTEIEKRFAGVQSEPTFQELLDGFLGAEEVRTGLIEDLKRSFEARNGVHFGQSTAMKLLSACRRDAMASSLGIPGNNKGGMKLKDIKNLIGNTIIPAAHDACLKVFEEDLNIRLDYTVKQAIKKLCTARSRSTMTAVRKLVRDFAGHVIGISRVAEDERWEQAFLSQERRVDTVMAALAPQPSYDKKQIQQVTKSLDFMRRMCALQPHPPPASLQRRTSAYVEMPKEVLSRDPPRTQRTLQAPYACH